MPVNRERAREWRMDHLFRSELGYFHSDATADALDDSLTTLLDEVGPEFLMEAKMTALVEEKEIVIRYPVHVI